MILTQEGKEIVAIYKQNGDEVDEVKDANGRLVYTNTREITGTLPLSFTSRGKPLADYRIYGNTVQDGTPSPDMPVDVQGVGEYDYVSGKYYISISGDTTELCDIHDIDRGTLLCGVTSYGYYSAEAYLVSVSTQSDTPNTMLIPIKSTATYRVRFKTNNTALLKADFVRVAFANEFAENAKVYNIYTWQCTGNDNKLKNDKEYYVTMANTNHRYLVVQSNLSRSSLFDYFSIQEVLSVTDLSSRQTTRRIKKLVLTGEENWTIVSGRLCVLKPANCKQYSDSVSTHFIQAQRATNPGEMYVGGSYFNFNYDGVNDNVPDFKSYLAAQYAAGTPVTIWYILAEQKTGIVNEPLMKIGNYADTITMAQAGVTVPTVNGTNVLDTTAPVKPSEVYIKGKGIRAIT